MAEIKKNQISGSLFQVNEKILASYPVDAISVSDIKGPKEYDVVDVIYTKPLGDQSIAKISIVVTTIDKELFNVTKDIKFKRTENQRVADSISPLSFWLKEEIRKDSPPDALMPSHFETKYQEIMILAVDYIKPEITVKQSVANLTVRMTGLNSVMQITIPIEFALTQEQKVLSTVEKDDFKIETDKDEDYNLVLKDIKYIGKHNIEIIQSKIETMPSEEKAVVQVEIKYGTKIKWIIFEIQHTIPRIVIEMKKLMLMSTIKPEFMKGCSPVNPKPDFIVYPKELRVISLKFVPPKTIESVNAFVMILFGYEGEVARHIIPFKFDKSIKQVADAFQKKLSGDDFIYVKAREAMAPPRKFFQSDFTVDFEDVVVKDFAYNFKDLKKDQTDIEIVIIADFRGIKITFPKKLSYKMSYHEWLSASKLTETINFDLITIPKEIHDPVFCKNLLDDPDKYLTKQILNSFFVGGQYMFDITHIKVSKFNVHEKRAEYIFRLEEKIEGDIIDREVIYPIHFSQTYAEQTLMYVKFDDIKVHMDQLPPHPPDEFMEETFSCDPLYTIISVDYDLPELTSRKAKVSIKLGAGDRVTFIPKTIEFPYSKEEYQLMLWEKEDWEYLTKFDPSTLNIHVNILGEPVQEIYPSDITGAPDGVIVETEYKEPKIGNKKALLIIKLIKGKAEVSFKQQLEFAMQRTKEGLDIEKTYTTMFQLPEKSKKQKNKRN